MLVRVKLVPQLGAMSETPCLKIRHSVKSSKVALAAILWEGKQNLHSEYKSVLVRTVSPSQGRKGPTQSICHQVVSCSF